MNEIIAFLIVVVGSITAIIVMITKTMELKSQRIKFLMDQAANTNQSTTSNEQNQSSKRRILNLVVGMFALIFGLSGLAFLILGPARALPLTTGDAASIALSLSTIYLSYVVLRL